MEVQKQKLQNISEFRKILKNYKPSHESLEIFKEVKQVILVGPTAAGRNTLINILEQTKRYQMIVSDTTRNPRISNGKLEKDGEVYWFKTEEEFLKGLRKRLYIEAAIIHEQQVSGASIEEFVRVKNSDKIALNEVQPDGSIKYMQYNPKILAVFLLPPTFDVWMQRLKDRGGMAKDELRRRLQSAQSEINHALNVDFYQFVINNDIHESAQAVDELANGRAVNQEKQNKGRNHTKQLASEVQLYLKNN